MMRASNRALAKGFMGFLAVAKPRRRGDNRTMPKASQRGNSSPNTGTTVRSPFLPGAMVVVTMGNPRDKFWGTIVALTPEGLSMSGVELASFEDLVTMVRDGELFTPAVVFFPMHRIERIELDLADGTLPSLSQRFSAKTGLDPAATLGASLDPVTSDHLASQARATLAGKKGTA
jgi:hypothetical protein